MTIEPVGCLNAPQISLNPQTKPNNSMEFEAVYLQSLLKIDCIQQHFSEDACFSPIPCEPSMSPCLPPQQTLTQSKPGPTQDALNSSIEQFVKSIWPYAQNASKVIVLDPKLLIAQAMLETGWGKYVASDATGSSYNLFNMKASSTDTAVEIKTTEYINGAPIHTTARFKKYDSYEQSFNDYIHLINHSPRYHNALANAQDPERYTTSLHQAGFATDPAYANKIRSIYYGEVLQQMNLNHSAS